MTGVLPRSLVDEAWSARVAGRSEDAIRAASAIVEADPSQLGAASLLLAALVDAGRSSLAGAVAARLVNGLVRRGDLPRALVASTYAGEQQKALRDTIASAFGKGSARLGDVAPAPPPLPVEATIDDELAAARGDALLDRGEAALKALLAHEDPAPEDARLPRLPLFSALPPALLEPTLAAFSVLEVDAGEAVVEEGAEGRDAFVVVRGHLRAERGGTEAPTVLAELGPGALFGEMALVSDAPRAASVIAREAVQLLVARRDALEALTKRAPQIGVELSSFCRARMLSNLMRHSAILRSVAPGDRAALIERFETRTFKPNERLVEEGKETEGLFLIASGAVSVTSHDPGGEVLQIAALGPGDVVGEISLVLRRPAMADVTATHLTVALELQRDQFQAAIKEHPGLLGELYDLATKREEETRTVVAQEALDVEEIVLL